MLELVVNEALNTDFVRLSDKLDWLFHLLGALLATPGRLVNDRGIDAGLSGSPWSR